MTTEARAVTYAAAYKRGDYARMAEIDAAGGNAHLPLAADILRAEGYDVTVARRIKI